jgi:hypothetical protein
MISGLIFKVLGFNALALIIIGIMGYFPMKILESRYRPFQFIERIFITTILGYFVFESLTAIWVCKGVTVQWLNLLVILYPLSRPKQIASISDKTEDWKPLIGISAILLFSVWYFVRSYSSNYLQIDHYPFIDNISYSSAAFGMQFSGHENSNFGGAIFFPELFKFNLYHFTELWAIVGWGTLFGASELFSLTFILTVFLMAMAAMGFMAIAKSLKYPIALSIALSLAILFANGKLLFFNDSFLFNTLDLGGLKICLLISILAFLFIIRHNKNLLLVFSILALQANVLFAPALVILWAFNGIKERASLLKQKPALLILSPFIIAGIYGFMLSFNKSASAELSIQSITVLDFANQAVTYFREAVFNLGYGYWLPFILLSILVNSSKSSLLLIPYFFSKISSKGLVMLFPAQITKPEYVEVLFFILTFLAIRPYIRQAWQKNISYLLIGIFILCLLAGLGNRLTNHMDFEQIYTMVSTAAFTFCAFFLFQKGEKEKGLIPAFDKKFFPLIPSLALLAITFFTFRFQRVIPFDLNFYQLISKKMETSTGNRFSAYFSERPFYPFPLHIQTGFPLLFEFPDAISTPVSIFEDSSWVKSSREGQVKQLPFFLFSESDDSFKNEDDKWKLQLRFIKTFKIQYLWVDKGNDSPSLNWLRPKAKSILISSKENLEFWEIDPEKILEEF